MPQARSVSGSVAPTISVVLAVLLACATAIIIGLDERPAARLPLGSNQRVIENSPTLGSVLDSGSSLDPGETRLLTTTLVPGHYVIVCDLPGHYISGMHVDITVT